MNDVIYKLADPKQLEPAAEKLFIKYLHEEMYSRVRFVEGFGYCGIMPMLFTVGVFHGLNAFGPTGRFCFNSLLEALAFYEHWDGSFTPTVGKNGCTAIK